MTLACCAGAMTDNMTPAQRSLRAKIAAHTSWANTADRSARTAAARKAALDRFERQVDPDGALPAEQRVQRAASARKAYFARLALHVYVGGLSPVTGKEVYETHCQQGMNLDCAVTDVMSRCPRPLVHVELRGPVRCPLEGDQGGLCEEYDELMSVCVVGGPDRSGQVDGLGVEPRDGLGGGGEGDLRVGWGRGLQHSVLRGKHEQGVHELMGGSGVPGVPPQHPIQGLIALAGALVRVVVGLVGGVSAQQIVESVASRPGRLD